MALQETQAEPSMEEILASIRRIISEDDTAPPAGPVLELSTPATDANPADDDDDLLVFDNEEEPPVPAPPVAPPAVAAAPVQPAPAPIKEAIMSEPVVSAAAQSFTRLADSLRLSDAPGQTLETVVRELLRPMLREWLEQNLPAIVESKVEAELDRISRLAR
jgi:cell pole-organizing protein PopZ